MRVFSNTAVSLDGRIGTTARDHVQVGSDLDRRRMSHLRAQADAVMVGGQTFRSWPHPLVELPEDATGRTRPLINAVLTRRGVGVPDQVEWTGADLHVFVGPEGKVEGVPDGQVHSHAAPSPVWVLDELATMGCEQVLIEGGGDLIFQLLAAGRLDEIYVTVSACIIGGVGAPSLADGIGFDASTIARLRLLDVEHVGDELFVHYAVKH